MTLRSHAAVIGGSIAGLWAARILADHFEHVTVIDRDHFPANPEARRGVPQGRQVHVLLVRGQQILDQLFPGIRADIQAEGVDMIRWTQDTRSFGTNGIWSGVFDFGYETMGCSRLLLEWHMRRRLLQNPKITFVEGRQVTGLVATADQTRVTGVKLEATGAERASVGVETLDADLIVDASGRESHAPEWLQALGYSKPEEIVVDAHVGYATRFYQKPESLDVPWKSLLVQSRSGNVARSSLIYPIEHDQWMALMVGTNVELPAENDDYLEFARTLPVPDTYNAIKDAQPLSPIYRYQRTANQRRRYDALSRLPDGFILIGDAVCAFNPVFGQGMTVSGMEALLLDEELKRGGDSSAGFALRFQQRVGRLIAGPWQLATSEDARNVKAGERVSLSTRLLKVYFDHLLGMIGRDPQLGQAFFDVMHLIKPPTTLFYPRVAVKVIRSMLTTRKPLEPAKPPQLAESH
jgi:2-polyprenyl-6-methoxyphenol hydroxylase-like FAD-dependent oxidoreductase